MGLKFQRHFKLTVQGKNGDTLEFNDPLTLEFTIIRNAQASMQTGSFRLYNLNQTSRGNIYRNKTDYDDVRTLKLQAGYDYQNPLPTIFSGCVTEAYSVRNSGSPDFITNIMGYDFNFSVVKSFSNFTKSPDQSNPTVTRQQIINLLVEDLIKNTPGNTLKKGTIGTFEGEYPRGRTIFGPTWDALKTETNRQCFIDNGRVFCLPEDEAVEGNIKVINSSTGLLSTPKKRETYLDIEVLFEPCVDMGQQIFLESVSSPQFNGYYKVLGIQHQGIISGAVSGKCTTILTLDYGSRLLGLTTESVTG
ncbi:hypothetical protein EKK58_10090 [Candidatus Dependentiae bacterium]|nr:MAG: hypothetical protein EKK58_10090 [Candidatus Dependentiae bacterium]